MDVRDKILAEYYEPKIAYPSKPEMPAILNKRVSELTKDEFGGLAEIKSRYEEELAAFHRSREEHRRQAADGIVRMRADLEVEFGVKGHPKADLLWSKAWDMGHSAGLDEIALYYEDLAELVV
jgi:hypothetical protein